MRISDWSSDVCSSDLAAYQVAPSALWELGAQVVAIGVEPNGKNINQRVGSTAPDTMCETVVASGAHLGIALDGDADRLIVCDEVGRIVDGDQLMATIATNWARRGLLRGGRLVATGMSHPGPEPQPGRAAGRERRGQYG